MLKETSVLIDGRDGYDGNHRSCTAVATPSANTALTDVQMALSATRSDFGER